MTTSSLSLAALGQSARSWRLTLVGIFLLALAVLAPGIQSPTGITGKDEYFLSLRTPLEMLEKDAWVVPVLNGHPRLKKPPMLSWLGRASYETFGPSLPAGRGVVVLLAALMVTAGAALGRRLLGTPGAGLWSAALLLSMLGLASESRRFMLDIPTAAFSTLAFLFFLRWQQAGRGGLNLVLGAVFLAAGFLIKGPIVALVCGGGILALLLARQWDWRQAWAQRTPLSLAALLFLALALPWFVWVRLRFPEASAAELQEELEARQFFIFSPESLLGLIQIALPWSFALLGYAWRVRREPGPARMLVLWFLLTFVPFFFIKTFDRYLVGSLVPLALLGAHALSRPDALRPALGAWGLRAGTLIALLLAGGFAAFAAWFHLAGWLWLVPPLAWLAWAGFRPRPAQLAGAALLTWLTLFAVTFPALGVNRVPPEVLALTAQRPVLMFDGPQPALLPMLLHRSLSQSSKLEDPALVAPPGLLVFARSEDVDRLATQLAPLGKALQPLGQYRVLSSRGSGIRFAREGAGAKEWREALAQHSLEPLYSTVRYFQLVPLSPTAPRETGR